MVFLDETQLVDLARKTLEIDEKPSASLPAFYRRAFEEHAARFPNDTNFIVEFARPDKKGSPTGGNGFGIATCLEDYCWTDVRLGADPSLPDGGKANGFGSLWEYEVHCEKADHVRGRDERCQKVGITYQPAETATRQNSQANRSQPSSSHNAVPARSSLSPVLPSDAELASWMSGSPHRTSQPKKPSKASKSSRSISSNAVAGPSRHTPLFSTPSWTRAMEGNGSSQSSSHRGSQILQPSDRHNHPSGSLVSQLDIKPKITSPNTSLRPHSSSIIDFLDDSESDNEVSVLRDDQIPSDLRKKTNKSNPYILSDDEDDGKLRPSQGSSSFAVVDRALGKPRALVGRSSQRGVNVFEQMMNERYPTVPHRSQGVKAEVPKTEPQPKQEQAPSSGVKSEACSGSTFTFGPTPLAGPLAAPITSASGIQVPGAYPSNAIAGPSQPVFHMPIRPSAEDEATRMRLQQALTMLKADRDAQLRREYPAARDLIRESFRSAGTALSTQEHRDLLTYSGQVLALITQPATMPFPILPAFVTQRWPWYNAISAESARKHQQYRDSQAAVNASALAGGGALDIKPLVGSIIPDLAVPGFGNANASLAARHGMTEEEFGNMYPHLHREGDRPANLQEFFTSALHDFSEDQDIDKALQTLGLTDVNQNFADMTVTLMPHQILGVAFMLEKEKDRKFRGGLLCDAMGLGKTVQAIATIIGHPSEDRRIKTTLIIAPLAVLQQWKSEIESKTADGVLKIHVHHGATRAKSSNILKNADIVLTTYGTMVADFAAPKKKKKTRRAANSDDDEEDDIAEVPRKKGPIFRIRWYRVILDEAHFIRNKNTQASKAVWDLDSIYRWSLTGTLINNSLDDVFPHLRFLDISPQSDWSEWRKHIAARARKSPRLAANRTQAILKTCMMRRHKESLLNGQRLLNLPPKETRIMELDFTEEEREIYNQVEQRMKIKFGKFLKQGTVLKHLSCVLTMLMRLRQLTCHPWLLRRDPGDPAHPDDFQVSDEDLYNSLNIPIANAGADFMNAINIMGEDWVADMAKRLRERYDRLLNAAKKDEETEKDNECSICLDIYSDEIVTECKHSFCRGCIDEIFANAPRDGGDLTDEQAASGARKCPMCRAVIEKKKVFAAVAFFDPEKEKDEKPDISEPEGSDRKGKRKSTGQDDDEFEDLKPDVKKLYKGKGKAKAEDDEEDVKPEEGLDRIESVLPSTKMKILGQLIDEYLAEPDIKVIVFSEFVSYLELCAIFLSQKDIPHRMYHGGMRTKDREDVVREFSAPIRDERSPRVMLISRKAGGAGLNLTAASKVISLDLAWNAAAENQSVDRAHRIGQTRPVDIRRLVIQNTVEQRILELQERKSALADGAMGEGTGGRLGRLSVQDLMRLFDYNHEDI